MKIIDCKKGFFKAGVFLILFLMIWAVWLGGVLQEWGAKNITDNGLSGVEALFYANLNIVIFIFLVVSTYLSFKFGGSEA